MYVRNSLDPQVEKTVQGQLVFLVFHLQFDFK